MNKRIQLFLFLIISIFCLEVKAQESAAVIQLQEDDSTDVLTAFTAKIKESEIHLVWKIANLKNISYFIVERRDSEHRLFEPLNANKRIKKADYIEKATEENNVKAFKYTYTDEPQRDGVYFYKIKAVDASNKLVFESDEIKIGISGIKDFVVEQNQPNPFNPVTTIRYELFSDTYVSLKVFDLIGREITTLVDEFQTKGKYSVNFDASLHSNLTSGIYFYKLQTEQYSDVKKMILSK
jgi:type IX secretion system substrate protein